MRDGSLEMARDFVTVCVADDVAARAGVCADATFPVCVAVEAGGADLRQTERTVDTHGPLTGGRCEDRNGGVSEEDVVSGLLRLCGGHEVSLSHDEARTRDTFPTYLIMTGGD